MKWIIPIMILSLSAVAVADELQVVEIGVKGMTCEFCVASVEKNLRKLDGVKEVHVDLKQNRARIVMAPGQKADVEEIKKLITSAGFTPGKLGGQK